MKCFSEVMFDYVLVGGNVTCDIILPRLPSTFSHLMGVDVNQTMVDYADRNYKIPKVSFSKLDVGRDINEFMLTIERPFDHVISFFTLHLIPDQRLAFQNIYNLLGPNGDCFLHVLVNFTGFGVYKRMFKKWSKYMVDIDDFVSPYRSKINPANIVRNHLKNSGFKEFDVVERRKTIAHHDIQMFKGEVIRVILSEKCIVNG